jgi:hypothetical protein
MQGHISQIATLTIWGNFALRQRFLHRALDRFANNSTFSWCNQVRFVSRPSRVKAPDADVFHTDPIAWFKALAADGAQGFRMFHAASRANPNGASDRQLVAFVGGGGNWGIEVVYGKRSDYWAADWVVTERGRSDSKIWRVTYRPIVRDVVSSPRTRQESFESLKQQLADILAQASEFAHAHRASQFGTLFDAGLARLSDAAPLAGLHHEDIAPPDSLPLPAAQLVGAVQAAWVFGGMGSWNDLVYDGDAQARYDALSDTLYQAMTASIVIGVNASA